MSRKSASAEINAAIFYHPEGYDTSHNKLMGRHAAGEGFLRGYAQYGGTNTLYAFANNQKHFVQFKKQVASYAKGKSMVWIPSRQPERLAEPGTLFLPGYGISDYAWRRRFHDPCGYSITGITHTICSDRAMSGIAELIIGPVEEWDALICTSQAVKIGVDNILSAYGNYLGERFNTSSIKQRLQLPVIPLGVDCSQLGQQGNDRQNRAKIRKHYGIGEQDVSVLYFGRLSFHAKAHPLPMCVAMEAVSRETDKKLHLVQAGWFAHEDIKNAFIQAARVLCPSVNVIFVDGRLPKIRQNIWSVADIFCSLSDNVQETFGLTPVEAMAAGLPVVASDWNGYQGTVEHGQTGFLIPTAMPAPGNGEELAYRYITGEDDYDSYIGKASQSISVDIAATTRALGELVKNPVLRRQMGERGQQRARDIFDWSVVIAAYEELWGDLRERRLAALKKQDKNLIGLGSPLRGDPYAVFGHYGTAVINAETVVCLTQKNPHKIFYRLSALGINSYVRSSFLPDKVIEDWLSLLCKQDKLRTDELLANVAAQQHQLGMRTIGWLIKMGILKVTS